MEGWVSGWMDENDGQSEGWSFSNKNPVDLKDDMRGLWVLRLKTSIKVTLGGHRRLDSWKVCKRSFFLSTLPFSESPLVSLGFYLRYFELQVAESVQLRRKVARFSCITLLFASDIAAILDLRHRLWHESEATLMDFEEMSFLQLFTCKLVRPVVFQD